MMQNTLPRKKRSFIPVIIVILIILIIVGVVLYFSKAKQTTPDNSTVETSATMPLKANEDSNIVTPEHIANIFTRSLMPEPSTPLLLSQTESKTAQSLRSDMTISDGPLILLSEQNNTVLNFHVEKGDTLSTLFNKAGLSNAVMYNALESIPKEQQNKFIRLNLGQIFEFTLNDAGDLLALSTKPDILNTYALAKQDNGYVFSHNAIKPTYKKVYAYGLINSSLFAAADKAGIPHAMIMEIANAFGYDIDFALDLRQGDEFEVIFEQKLVNGKVVGTGNLLAARFINRGKEFTVVRFTNNKVAAYYRADGTSMQRAFIRTPVDFTRISSKFSMGRFHPVLNRIRAHKGVDYAAPTGTAIKAAGNGKIVSLGWKGGYGNAIVIQHGKTYSTLYGHMSKFAPGLKAGSYVKQSQTIGYVGMTGLATGPHLHYEFRVNGKHVDPLSVKLPMADPLSAKEKARFLKISQPLVTELNENKAITLAKMQADKDNGVDTNTTDSETTETEPEE